MVTFTTRFNLLNSYSFNSSKCTFSSQIIKNKVKNVNYFHNRPPIKSIRSIKLRNFVATKTQLEKMEESNNIKTFSKQNDVPRQPIPTLHETLDRYKKTLIPLLSTEEYNNAIIAVDEFMRNGIGEILQGRLYELDKVEPYNWIEIIWLNKAYLEWREPILINVNWWGLFEDPETGILNPPPPNGQISEFQINRAAGFISNMLNFNEAINNESIPPESTRQGPLCMNQYKRQFGVSRIPDFPIDRIITTWPSIAKHIIVIYKDQIFKVQVLGERGERVSIDSIKRQLHLLIEQVNNYNNNSELQPPIGLLTGEHRDLWAKTRHKLETNPKNKVNLETIDNSLFVVALDDYSVDKDISHHNNFHAFNGRNRWFDKSIQIILQNNGQAGVNCEHTPSDAVASGRIFDDIVSNEPAKDPPNSTSISLPAPQHLNWVIDNTINDIIHNAQINIQNAIDNVDSVLLYYYEYGSNWLKNVKYSPDAFVQMAIQLAYYRQYGEPCATYESASTRGFLHGRTETVRSCSVDSLEFTKAFDDKDIKKGKKIELFTTAIKSHIEYMIAAVNGKGVDRHLLGLRTQLQSDKEKESASLFNDPSYQKSSHYKLSTSNMSLGVKFICGFGAVVPDGYGVCYMINPDKLRFAISSYKKCKETDSVIFRKTLIKTLDDLRETLS
ncbi:hypothetical protein Glove_396g10 [Diversispora epigaea]|uniref:Choline/carnitine acyltransferase domain-containing protein n=1 Tax=Diversispora epigaea TaxID=1348612 RepID=A0A397H4N6_9GLOM|nr:hypothetical protein Glove_396g10 [Diversispora epigaea]